MSNTDTTDQTPGRTQGRTPGPWDAKPEATSARETAPAPAAEAPVEKDQSLVWAMLSTALMGGFLWRLPSLLARRLAGRPPFRSSRR